MTERYEKLLEPLELTNGAVLPNRIVMAPMVAEGSTTDGTVTEEDLDYFDKRSKVAGMIITGGAAVAETGRGFKRQISVSKDSNIEGLKKLASTMKQDGSKAIIQIYHGGREARVAHELFGETVAPSAIDFPFLPYTPRAFTADEILEVIKEYGAATKRAIEAGFDGVEIHGANHYLIHQFFSSYSNQREDEWGGSLAKRMNFPLAVVREVKRIVAESGKKDFIVGYRISPEEIHDENVGYTFDEALQLIDKLADHQLDYIHVSLFTTYKQQAVGGKLPIGQAVQEQVNGRAAVIIVSNVFSADDAVDALNYGDVVGIGRAALVEPEFTEKIKTGQADDIVKSVTPERLSNLAFPRGLIEWYTDEHVSLPPLPGVEYLK